MVEAGLNTSITGRAVKNGLISVDAVNIRDYTNEPHGKVDDYPYGGGAGMIMQAQPVYDCCMAVLEKIRKQEEPCPASSSGAGGVCKMNTAEAPAEGEKPDTEVEAAREKQKTEAEAACGEQAAKTQGTREKQEIEADSAKGSFGAGRSVRVLYTSPAGRLFNQEMARELAKEKDLIILCGHYEGVDERALKLIAAEDVSIGDYVLTGGELAAMVITDAVSRMVPGVLSNEESGVDESFSKMQITRTETDTGGKWPKKKKVTREYTLLEYPQYTRPASFMGLEVPEILLSGHHENIEKWRKEQALERTRRRRPDMLKE